MTTDLTTTAVLFDVRSARRWALSSCPFEVSCTSQPYGLEDILNMQLAVALFGKGGIPQSMLASDQMEIQEFLWVRDKMIELSKKSSGGSPEQFMDGMSDG